MKFEELQLNSIMQHKSLEFNFMWLFRTRWSWKDGLCCGCVISLFAAQRCANWADNQTDKANRFINLCLFHVLHSTTIANNSFILIALNVVGKKTFSLSSNSAEWKGESLWNNNKNSQLSRWPCSRRWYNNKKANSVI